MTSRRDPDKPDADTGDIPTIAGDPPHTEVASPPDAGATARTVATSSDETIALGADSYPSTIGRYPILSELGRGGMGVVYVARDPQLGRRIALKILPDVLSTDRNAFIAFRREAQLLAALNHRNVATVHSLEDADGTIFLTMEFIDGVSLAGWRPDDSGSLEEIVRICRQIAMAVEAAHEQGIVHRDLKPQNVMIRSDGEVKVLDFGIALALESSIEQGAGRDAGNRGGGQIAGTPGYMSPEQIRGAREDARTDVFALGCIIGELLTGRPVFPGSTIRDRLNRTLTVDPELSDCELSPDHPLRLLVMHCLEKDPGARLESMTALRQALEEIQATLRARDGSPGDLGAENNLPASISSFVGRERELSTLVELVAENRLVTVTGPAGGGKSRLTVEVGRELVSTGFDGLWLIELAGLTAAGGIEGAIARVLGVRDAPGQSPLESLQSHLAQRHVLLVLDNCEHVLDDCRRVVRSLLQSCRALFVLATSREPLGESGEVVFPISTLTPPPVDAATCLEDLVDNDAVRLFVDRARAARPEFVLDAENAGVVAGICRRLDGIPLALELAAARLRVLSVDDLDARLVHRFRVLGSRRGQAAGHHRTLRELIDWSYDFLDDTERRMLRYVSVFSGGWTLEAAETVCAVDGIEEWEVLDLISELVSKSLVDVRVADSSTDSTRYRMLETVREYARERLTEAEELADLAMRHAMYFVTLAERAAPELTTSHQVEWLTRLRTDQNNLQRALETLFDTGELGGAARLAGALGRYWVVAGRWQAGRAAYHRLFDAAEPGIDAASALCLSWSGNLAKLQGEYAEARALLERSLDIRRQLGEPTAVAESLNNLGNVLRDLGEWDAAEAHYRESHRTYEAVGNEGGVALALNGLGAVAFLTGRLEDARAAYTESLAIRRRQGDRNNVAASLNNLATVEEATGNLAQAGTLLDECLSILRELGDRSGIATALNNLGRLARAAGDDRCAIEHYEESLRMFRELGNRSSVAIVLLNLVAITVDSRDESETRALLAESLLTVQEFGDERLITDAIQQAVRLARRSDDPARAATLLASWDDRTRAAGSHTLPQISEFLNENRTALERALGAEAFSAAWNRGRSLDRDTAILVATGATD